MLKAQTLLTLLERLDPADRKAALRFDSLAFAYLGHQPVIMFGVGFVTVRTHWPGAEGVHTNTRFPQFHRLKTTRARLMVKALERGEAL